MSSTVKKSVRSDERIKILDGFRAIAIIAVILYHYFYRWDDPVQPYSCAEFFHYGFRGVPFFFMISGFVICYSLEGTENYITFWKKRFIRLFPSIFVASILTFMFLIVFDKSKIFEDSTHFRNVIISITFLPPNIFNLIFGTANHFSYINYSYWSLWPEIQFYVFASTIYFFNRIYFKRNFIIICFLLLVTFNSILFFNLNQIKLLEKAINLFSLIQYLPFFLSGALFYMLYKNKKHFIYILFLLFAFILMNLSLITSELIASLIMFALFFFFIYYPAILAIFESRFLVSIGVSSYFLYLIHENIGVVWIRNIIAYFYPHAFIAPVLIIIIMVLFSIYYTLKIESRIIKYLNSKLLKRKND